MVQQQQHVTEAGFSGLTDGMEQMVEQLAGTVVQAVSRTLSSTVSDLTETMSQKIELAAKITQISQRAEAYSSVLEISSKKRMDLQRLTEKASGKAKKLLEAQIRLLEDQEARILEQAMGPATRQLTNGKSEEV